MEQNYFINLLHVLRVSRAICRNPMVISPGEGIKARCVRGYLWNSESVYRARAKVRHAFARPESKQLIEENANFRGNFIDSAVLRINLVSHGRRGQLLPSPTLSITAGVWFRVCTLQRRGAARRIVGWVGLVIKSARAVSLDDTKSIVTRARTCRCSQHIIPPPSLSLADSLPLSLSASTHCADRSVIGPDSHFRGRLFRTSCNNQISRATVVHAPRQLIAMKTRRVAPVRFLGVLPVQINRCPTRNL